MTPALQVIDGYFPRIVAASIARELEAVDLRTEEWHRYEAPFERKYACADPAVAGPWTNAAAHALLERLPGGDPTFRGGGLHAMGPGDFLSVHLDASRHSVTGRRRAVNIVWFGTPCWRAEWGGAFELWSNRGGLPSERVVSIAPLFNRALIMAVDDRAWHGVPDPIHCPPGVFRRSIAAFGYDDGACRAPERARALFAPRPDADWEWSMSWRAAALARSR